MVLYIRFLLTLYEILSKIYPVSFAYERSNTMKEKVVLFDGKNLDNFYCLETKGPVEWAIKDGVATVTHGNIVSNYEYGDAHVHVEFNLPYMPDKTGQSRANSGVYIQGVYEIQVLDCYGKEVLDANDVGAIYNITAPIQNPAKKPGEWQTYDVYFRTIRRNEDGSIKELPRITVVFNGTVIQNNFEIPGLTGGAIYPEMPDKGPLLLQDHGNPVSFRNVWVQPLD